MNFAMLALKTEKLSGFLRTGSKLFDSIMGDEKKKFWFVLRRGILCIFLVSAEAYLEPSQTSTMIFFAQILYIAKD